MLISRTVKHITRELRQTRHPRLPRHPNQTGQQIIRSRKPTKVSQPGHHVIVPTQLRTHNTEGEQLSRVIKTKVCFDQTIHTNNWP